MAVDICLPCGTCYYCRRGDHLLCDTFNKLVFIRQARSQNTSKRHSQNCYIVPDSVTDYQAAFIEPLTTTLNASRKMDLKIASSLVVIGCGLGIIHARLGKIRGAAPVIVVGDSQERLKMSQMGVDHTIDITVTPDAVAEVKKLTDGIGADYVDEAVGTSKTYEQAFKW